MKPMTMAPPIPANPFDAAYYASRFKADLTELGEGPGEHDLLTDAPRPADIAGDQILYDFFGNLSVLLVSVRTGDLDRARAAADALELEVMVEHSAGAAYRSGPPNMLDDLRHLLNAAQSGDEIAARSAAQDLARDVKRSLDAPRFPLAQVSADPAREPPVDAAAAYDALMAYIGDDGQSCA